MSPEISSSTPPTESLKRINTDTSTDRPTLNSTSKTPDRDTMSCCSPCLQGLWRPIRNFFIAIWNFFCCKCRNNPSETVSDSVQPPGGENGPRNWADELLKNQYENVEEKPDYQRLESHVLTLKTPQTRYPFTEFLLELLDFNYEPKRKAVSPDLIKIWIDKIGLGSKDTKALCSLCDQCAKQQDYTPLVERLKEVDRELRPIGPEPTDEKQWTET